jgi:DUF1365 family protein
MHSCLYRGHVRHRRPAPAHRFTYSTSWIYLDLAEIEQVLSSSRLLSDRRFWPATYRRQDHFGDPGVSMIDAVYQFVEQKTGLQLSGPVRMLTQLRHFGLYFSPINVFYCFDDQETLVAMVAEVSNTPWNERHCYVLWQGNRVANSACRYSHAKEFHVSPFMGMDSQYEWHIRSPDDALNLSLGCTREGQRIFQADLHLKRTELNESQLALGLLRRPIAAVHLLSGIYYQALRLWMKKCQFYPHLQTSCDQKATGTPASLQPGEAAPRETRHLEEA